MTFNRADIRPSPELSFVTGAYLGDGNIRTEKRRTGTIWRLRFLVKDRDFLEALNENLTRILERHRPYRITTNRRGYYELAVCSKSLCLFLQKPKERASVARSYPREFLKGIFDAEGGVGELMRQKVPRVVMYNRERKIIELVSKLLGQIGIRHKINEWLDKGKPYSRIAISRTGDVRKFADLVGFSIYRKYAKLALVRKVTKAHATSSSDFLSEESCRAGLVVPS